LKFNIESEIPFKEPISNVELVDFTGDGRDNLILTTVDGAIKIFEFKAGKAKQMTEIASITDVPPLSSVGLGDVTGDGAIDIVAGNFDNIIRVLSNNDGTIEETAKTPVGTLPTAICVTNVVGNQSAEVIVSTNDKALRCYGWFDGILDKLAHKVVENPVFSIQPLRTEGFPYSRFVFGDESGHVYIYQYADDRLHERKKFKVKGEVTQVATGNLTDERTDDILVLSDGNMLALYGMNQNELEKFDSLKAPSAITSILIESILDKEKSRGQIVSSQGNSKLTLFSLVGRRLVEEVTIKTASKALESHVAVGDIVGDDKLEIIQAVGNTVYVLAISDEE
jgi:hypothetical protein